MELQVSKVDCGFARRRVAAIGRRCLVSLLGLTVAVAAACGGASTTAAPSSSSTAAETPAPAAAVTPTPTAAATAAPSPTRSDIVWLCLPGKPHNPCEATLTTTVLDSSGKRTVKTLTPAVDPPIDCFYVYPTFSRQPTMNADLSIDPELVTIATWQAAPFSQVCRVYAPVYPQMTIAGLNSGAITAEQWVLAYSGVLNAFDDYLATYNRGRRFVLFGHSQGAMHLVTLLQDRFEASPEARKLLLSALLMGGGATTGIGRTTGGDFAEIPTCTSATQTGCVVGYSSFSETPPEGAAFGRMASAIGRSGRGASSEQIMCVNPTSIGGKGLFKEPLFASSDLPRVTANPPKPLPDTTFVTYPNAYAAECRSSGDATWLHVTRVDPNGAAPILTGTEGRAWGLHDFDVSLPLGNLLDLIRSQSAAPAS